MKRLSVLFFLFLFAAGFNGNTYAETKKENTAGFLEWFQQQTDKEKPKDGEEGEAGGAAAPEIYKPIPVAYKALPKPVEVIRPVASSPVVSVRTAPALPVRPPQTVTTVQAQVQELVELNKTIDLARQTQSLEIQRVVEQARIHQKILDKLKAEEEDQEKSADPLKSKVREEKLKAIADETQKSKSLVKEQNKNQNKTQNKNKNSGQTSSSQPKPQGWFFG